MPIVTKFTHPLMTALLRSSQRISPSTLLHTLKVDQPSAALLQGQHAAFRAGQWIDLLLPVSAKAGGSARVVVHACVIVKR